MHRDRKVVLVFTDIEGSTPLWERAPDAMRSGLDLHNDLLRTLIAGHGGYEVKTEGDAFMVAFESAQDAVRWCLAAQESLFFDVEWPEPLLMQPEASLCSDGLFKGFRVRMGVHIGEARRAVDPTTGRFDYFGPMVNRAARVSGAAHGGQIIVSGDVLGEAGIGAEAVCEDLGEHRLKGMERVERLWQVLPRRLAERRFPPPRTLDPRRTNLSPHPSSFKGREKDLVAMGRLFEDARLLTLLGPGGAGKTRLSSRYAGQALHEYVPGGAWFADLSEARSLADILAAVSRALSVPLTAGATEEDGTVQLGNAIAGRGRILLLLDNFEQIVELAPQTVGRWMKRAPEARFLVTSREQLRLDGECVWEVGPLTLDDASDLFVDRARASKPGFRPTEPDLEAIREIVEQLDGFPLAIELAAARAGIMSAGTIRDRLNERFRLLRSGRRGAASRQATLMGAIDWSWDLLSPWEREALAQCSVFRGGFTLEAAEAVIDISAWEDAPWPMDVVQALVEKSLVRRMSSARDDEEMRFGLYESIREYAATKLREPAPAEVRHGAFYARLGREEAVERLHGPEQLDVFRVLEEEFDNLVSAARRGALRGDPEVAAGAALAASEVFERRGPFDVGRELLSEALALGLDDRSTGMLELRRVTLARMAGRSDEARAAVDSALAISQNLGDRRFEGFVLGALGALHHEQGRMDEAREHYEAALEIHREVGNRRLEGVVLGNLGILQRGQNRMDEALKHFEAALEIHREVGDRRFEGIRLGILGGLHFQQGRMDEGRKQCHAALNIHREVGNRPSEGVVLGNLGLLLHEQGRMDEAREHYRAALGIHREVGNRRFEGVVLGNLGFLHREQGRMDEALEHCSAALTVHREVGNRRSEGVVLGSLGSLYQDQGRMDEAREHYEAALDIHRELANRLFVGIVLGNLGSLCFEQGLLEEARTSFDAGEALLREKADPIELGKLLCKRALYSLAEGDRDSSLRMLDEAESLAEEAGAGPGSELGRLLAEVKGELGDSQST